jgi:hypothetical protein
MNKAGAIYCVRFEDLEHRSGRRATLKDMVASDSRKARYQTGLGEPR